jgi:exopolyphosphatase/guanosine-5'-triphosphate,3'-diphosphate pyrophosphatase
MKKIALVDIGSNTVRLCIYKVKEDLTYQLLVNIKESVRLRNYVVESNLSNDGLDSLSQTLSKYKSIINKKEVDIAHFFATQTIRMIENKVDVIDYLYHKFGFKINVLTGRQEAQLGYEGMIHYLKHEKNGVYVDMGGGSTEIVYYKNNKLLKSVSFDFGSIVLRNMITSAIPNDSEVYFIRQYVKGRLDELDWLKSLRTPLIVVGGSSRNLVRIDKFFSGRDDLTHGYQLGFRELQRTRKILQLLSVEEIKRINGFTESRADIIVPSLIALEMIYEYVDAKYYVSSSTGLREGVLLNLLGG